MFHRHPVVERHQPLGDARLVGELDQVLAPLLLLDFRGARQQGVEIAVFGKKLCCGLHADARHARDVVHRVAGQRLHVDDLVRHHAEFLQHGVFAHVAVLHRVVERHAGADQLHQVLVGGNDTACRTRLHRLARIGGDEVVGLVIVLLDGRHVEGAGRLLDQSELRAEIGRRLGALRLVGGIDVIAEGSRRLVEDHRQMGGFLPGIGVL